MNLSIRRIRAVARKEMREYRRTASIVAAMAVIPLVFVIQPLVVVFALPGAASGQLAHEHLLLYLLGIPALVPALLAAYGVVGERTQGTLEPMLTTPVRREEFLLGKALAVFLPSIAIAYTVYALFLAVVRLFANPAVAAALLQWPQIVAQVVFTPLIAAWTIWVGLAVSARSNDIRVAQQLALPASLPTVLVTSLTAYNVIHPTFGLAVILGAVLLCLDVVGWRIVSLTVDRERLITRYR